MDGQRQALLNMLVVLRESLRDLDDIAPDLEDLGERHIQYGAQAAHYPVVANAMVAAMADVCGPTWNRDIESDWRTAIERIADLMLSRA
jgi:hemoglobin-like flavoprotein